jgi:hypothetical protein
MNRFENLLQQMRAMAAAARASYDERTSNNNNNNSSTSTTSTTSSTTRRSREFAGSAESGSSAWLASSSPPRSSVPIAAASTRRRARASSNDDATTTTTAIGTAWSPPESPSRFSELDLFSEIDRQFEEDNESHDDDDLFLTPLVPPCRDLTLQLDSLTLERVLFYAGAVRCRAVCRRWASMPIRSFVLLRGDHMPTSPPSSLLPLLRRVEVRRGYWPADCLDVLLRDAPRLERLTCVARHRGAVGGALVARVGGALHNLRALTDRLHRRRSAERADFARW